MLSFKDNGDWYTKIILILLAIALAVSIHNVVFADDDIDVEPLEYFVTTKMFVEDDNGNRILNPALTDSQIIQGIKQDVLGMDAVEAAKRAIYSTYVGCTVLVNDIADALDNLVDATGELLDQVIDDLFVDSNGMIKSGNPELGQRFLDKLVEDNTPSGEGTPGGFIPIVSGNTFRCSDSRLVTINSTIPGAYITTSYDRTFVVCCVGSVSPSSISLYIDNYGNYLYPFSNTSNFYQGSTRSGYYSQLFFSSFSDNRHNSFNSVGAALVAFYGYVPPSGEPTVVVRPYDNTPLSFRALPYADYDKIYKNNTQYYITHPDADPEVFLQPSPVVQYQYPNITFDQPYWLTNLTVNHKELIDNPVNLHNYVPDDSLEAPDTSFVQTVFEALPARIVTLLMISLGLFIAFRVLW